MQKRQKTELDGVSCECGQFTAYTAYVAAHWNERLVFTCPKCTAKYDVIQGQATPIKPKDRKRPAGDVRPIQWNAVSAKEQAHQMCRYCQQPATWMRKQGRQGWVPLCLKHAGWPGNIIPGSLPSVR